MRSDQGLNSIITDAKELTEKIEVDANFEKETLVWPRKVKKNNSPMRVKIKLYDLVKLH